MEWKNKSGKAKAEVFMLSKNKWIEKIQIWQEINERITEIVLKINEQPIIIFSVYMLNDGVKVEKNDNRL